MKARLTVCMAMFVTCPLLSPQLLAAEELPKVLIIGDSISIGYTKPLIEILQGKAKALIQVLEEQAAGIIARLAEERA